ncbi:MAG: phytoene desaturase family protein [Actinomycetota bacterium]
MTHDVVVIGAGHNGLATAALLARAGRKVLVVERRERVGGLLDTEEVVPGVRVPGPFLTVGRLRPSLVATLRLADHGYRPVVPAARVFAPQADGTAITLWADVDRTARELGTREPADAEAWSRVDAEVRGLARFVRAIQASTPPDLESPSLADAMTGLRLGRAFRRLGARGGREATRLLPMAVADLLAERFRDPALRGTLAVRGVRHTGMGPWSAGTAAVFLTDAAEGPEDGLAGEATQAVGGPGALAEALAAAARAAGAEIRLGAEVVSLRMSDGRVAGVVLADGEEIAARAVASAADPKRTLTTLADPVELGPHLRWRARNIRTPGTVSRVDLVCSGLPAFRGGDPERLAGRIVVGGTIDDLERAHDATKYGRIADAPLLEATIPTLADPGLASEGRHVVSVLVQGTPYRLREGDWDAERERLVERVLARLEPVAPGIRGQVVASRALSPVDLERVYGVSGGHLLHADPGLDQWFAWRPLLGHARGPFGLPGLYLCGSGAHAGGGVTGGPAENAARAILRDR